MTRDLRVPRVSLVHGARRVFKDPLVRRVTSVHPAPPAHRGSKVRRVLLGRLVLLVARKDLLVPKDNLVRRVLLARLGLRVLLVRR